MTLELFDALYQDLIKLASIAGLSDADLQKYFYPEGKATPRGILIRLCSSLQNSGNMRNSIKFMENRDTIRRVLFNFNISRSASEYSDWKMIYEAMNKAGITDNGDRSKRETNWDKYCHGLYDGLMFLNSNSGVQQIKNYVKMSELTDEIIEEINQISKNIHGLGFPLACDWLKECGCTWLAKPDIHIKEVMKRVRHVDNIENEDVLRLIFSWSNTINARNTNRDITPYIIDKVIWLLCTGNFYLDDISIGRESVYRKIDEYELIERL